MYLQQFTQAAATITRQFIIAEAQSMQTLIGLQSFAQHINRFIVKFRISLIGQIQFRDSPVLRQCICQTLRSFHRDSITKQDQTHDIRLVVHQHQLAKRFQSGITNLIVSHSHFKHSVVDRQSLCDLDEHLVIDAAMLQVHAWQIRRGRKPFTQHSGMLHGQSVAVIPDASQRRMLVDRIENGFQAIRVDRWVLVQMNEFQRFVLAQTCR
mmetsp:Transcript_20400/g.32424  ORF Transcript_20400/g.32424 Transcript_20400/m.32424 type:complete len:210 (+) Transcript_20400:123-752(+)